MSNIRAKPKRSDNTPHSLILGVDYQGRDYYGTEIARAGASSISANVRTAVILSAAKDLRAAHREILRCAQDDRWWVRLATAWEFCGFVGYATSNNYAILHRNLKGTQTFIKKQLSFVVTR